MTDINKDLKERIGDEAYRVTQENATERPFTGKYVDEKGKGIYKCVVCGAELFDSKTKFSSRSGWPSFYDVKHSDAVSVSTDSSYGMVRDEVSCKSCGAHLGHVFNDAPHTPTGQGYCINSCSLDLDKDKNA